MLIKINILLSNYLLNLSKNKVNTNKAINTK